VTASRLTLLILCVLEGHDQRKKILINLRLRPLFCELLENLRRLSGLLGLHNDDKGGSDDDDDDDDDDDNNNKKKKKKVQRN
jgi:hypothetical protein